MAWIDPIPEPSAESAARFPQVPRHIAIIMDGNGRWATGRGHQRIVGHWEGANRVDEITRECARLGVSYLSLYAFSTENWNRPAGEVGMLMQILVHYLRTKEKSLLENKIRLTAQGTLDRLPERALHQLEKTRAKTEAYTPRMYLNLCLSYGGRQEIVDATRKIAQKVIAGELSVSAIMEKTIQQHLYQANFPDPDLIIRSGGESRLSNFLLWQAAYAEFHVTDTLWPDFNEKRLHEAIEYFVQRERRYGKTSAQVQEKPLSAHKGVEAQP